MDREYDPATCWTARELRELGVDIPAEVSDASWLPVEAVVFDRASARPGPEPGEFTIAVFVKLLHPMNRIVLEIP